MSMKLVLALLTALPLSPRLLPSAAEHPKFETGGLVVVENGKPACSIYYEPGAPPARYYMRKAERLPPFE